MSKKKNDMENQISCNVENTTNQREYIVTGDMTITHCGKHYVQGDKIWLTEDCAVKLSKYISEVKK